MRKILNYKLFNHRFTVLFYTIIIAVFYTTATSATDIGQEPRIGPTQIRFYSGNLHVGMFMDYWGIENQLTGTSGDIVDDALIKTLKRTSCGSMCDYITWAWAEQKPRQWNWRPYLDGAMKLESAELGYNIFCWLHFPPKWYLNSDKFVGYVNLETGKSIPQLSLWSPDLQRIFERFYKELYANLGSDIDFIRMAMPSEYGEVGYSNGMTKWLVPQENAGAGYWCGDKHAKADFRKLMLKKYTQLNSLNAAWGTNFKSFDKIEMPLPEKILPEIKTSAQARRYWVDFIDWYHQAWVLSMEQVSSIIRQYFPQKELIASLGYGSEHPRLGNDQGRHIEAMSRLNLACQSPGDIGYFATRRVSSACRHYNVPYYTEPPGDVPAERQLNRIFMDISNGTQTWFDYPQNLVRGIEYFKKYKKYLTGEPPRTTVALWHPTLDHWLDPDQPWSKPAIELSEPLREVTDYEILDDRMIITGALESLKIDQLILAGANWLDRDAWQKVHNWIANGGAFIVLQSNEMKDIEGSSDLWQKQISSSIPSLKEIDKSNKFLDKWIKRFGKGFVLTVDCRDCANKKVAQMLGSLCTRTGCYINRPDSNAKLIDNRINGLLATRFDDKILYYNYTQEDILFEIKYRKKDFPTENGIPEIWELKTIIPARKIYSVKLIDKQ